MDSLVAENIERLRTLLTEKVTLIAVSKTKPVEDIMEAYDAGHRDFGENRIQEMAEKYEKLPKDIRWHMIGHVQNNKIKLMAPFVNMVHGMDKPKRFRELNKEAEKNDRTIDCLLQVHIAREESKYGFTYEEAWEFLNDGPEKKYPNLRLRGLMGMATLTEDEQVIRNEFSGLHQFYRKCKNDLSLACFDTLSMGMSDDYPLAVDEGSNMVRIGSAIFGKRQYR